MKRRNIGTILLAVLLIAVGAVLIGIYFFNWKPYWFAGWWTLLIMAAAIVSMVSQGPRFWSCTMLGTAVLLFARLQEFILHTWSQFWAAEVALALIALGVALIVHMLKPRKMPLPPPPVSAVPPVNASYNAPPPVYTAPPQAESGPVTGEAFPTRFALFSGEACRSDCRQLKGGRFSAVFGSVVANLAQADFAQPITVEVNSCFGGVDIITPPGVRVECTGTSILGGCDAKSIAGRPYDPTHPALTIRYLNVFGGVNVK